MSNRSITDRILSLVGLARAKDTVPVDQYNLLSELATDLLQSRGYAVGKPGSDYKKMDMLHGFKYGDDALDADRALTLRRVRILVENNLTAKVILWYIKRRVLGHKGIMPSVKTSSTTFNKQVEKAFYTWAFGPNKIDYSGTRNFYDAQTLWLMEMITTGEGFSYWVMGEGNFTLENFEVEQLLNLYSRSIPVGIVGNKYSIHEGIEYDGRKALAFYIEWVEPGQMYRYDKYVKVPSSQVQRLSKTTRPTATRGESEFVTTLKTMYDISDADVAELTALRAAAYFGLHVKPAPGQEGAISIKNMGGKKSTTPTIVDGEQECRNKISAKPGSVNVLAADVSLLDANRPGNVYLPFTSALTKKVAAAHGLPYVPVSGDASQANYSSSRVASMPEVDRFKEDQETIITKGCVPVFHNWLVWATMKGLITPPKRTSLEEIAYHLTEWQVRGQEWVDIKAELERKRFELESGISTWSQIVSASGKDPIDQVELIKKDAELAEKYDVKIPLCGVPIAKEPTLPTTEPDPSTQKDNSANKVATDE